MCVCVCDNWYVHRSALMCVQNDVSCMYRRRHCPACVYNAVVIVIVDVVIVLAIAVVVILIFVLVILTEDYLSLSTPTLSIWYHP